MLEVGFSSISERTQCPHSIAMIVPGPLQSF